MKEQNELLINDVASNNYEDIRNKQIVEIGQVMCNEHNKEVADALSLLFATLAESLYNVGYRKQSATDTNVGNKLEWISVEERLPNLDPYGKGRYGGRRSVRVLCACKQKDGRAFVKEGYYEPYGDGFAHWRIPGSIGSVTHWMPLPEPPKMKGE